MPEKLADTAEQRLLTCVLPAGKARDIMKKLLTEKGIATTFISHARGKGQSGALRSGVAGELERDILVALVPGARAEEIFEYLYQAARIAEPHQGILFVRKVTRATPCVLPRDLPEHF